MDSYVASSPPEPNERRNGRAGRKSEWAGMDSVVREADEKKVKDCKEDIDTLLVFAGLFSAVLTAFVIESYQNLQPDPSTRVIELLTQISSQLSSYALTAEFANSTAQAISQIDVFKPAPSMVKVNALWFASLICSLVTASLGMLVKQWLREYMSGDYYSPQARLRARQFRHGGLVAWKVYDVAALLPLLLQVALGLFFLGLCIFTHSVNSSVGWTSIPLVSAWLLILLLTTIAPAFSARCPYKVTFLISGLRVIRRWARHLLSRAYCHLQRPSMRGSQGISANTLPEAHDSQSTLPHFAQSYSFIRTRKVFEEEEALMSERNDISILLTIDSMLSDDMLIGTTFREHIWQLHSPGEDVVDFVLRVMGRRLQRGRRVLPSDLPLVDLRPLTKHAWIGLTGILADALHNEIYQEMHSSDDSPAAAVHRELRPWMRDMLKIIMSNSGYTFQQSEAEILVYSLLYDPTGTVPLMQGTRRRVDVEDCTDILRMCRRTLGQFRPTAVTDCTLHIIRWCTHQGLRSCKTLERAVTSTLFSHEGVLDIADIAIDMLTSEVQGQLCGRISRRWHDWMNDALCTVIYGWTLLRDDDDEEDEHRIADICGAVGLLCTDSPVSMGRFLCCVGQSVDSGRNSFLCHRLLARAMAHSCVTDRDYYSIMDHFITIVKDSNSADGDSFALDLVHMYHIASHMSVHRRPSIPDDNSQLRTLFTHLLIGLRAQESNTEAPPELTESCYMILSSLGSDNQDTGLDISQTLAEDLEVTWSSDDFALGRKQRPQGKEAKEKDAESWLSDAAGARRGALPGDAVLASLAADLEGSEMLHSTPGRPSRITRRQSTSSRPKIPPLLLRKDST